MSSYSLRVLARKGSRTLLRLAVVVPAVRSASFASVLSRSALGCQRGAGNRSGAVRLWSAHKEETNEASLSNVKERLEAANSKLFDAKVERQKRRALELWQECCAKKSIDATIQANVVSDLKQGLVPPIFHALVRSGGPLFLDDDSNDERANDSCPWHSLSISNKNQVESGTPLWSPLDVVAQTPIFEMGEDYFSVFLSYNECHGIPVVEDSSGRGRWKFDAAATQLAVDLVNTKAAMVGEDVEVTALAAIPFVDTAVLSAVKTNARKEAAAEAEDKPFNLITRRLSRGVVADCFDSSCTGSQRAITGSEGVGKSWTLLYALQQALLYENACVVYILQKQATAICYMRKESRIFAWVARESAAADFFDHENVLVLLDPKESGATYINGKCRLIFAAFNHWAHFQNDIFKTQRNPERFLSPWTEEELAVALPKMNEQVKMEDALWRAKRVGLLPRYLMCASIYEKRRRDSRAALNKLTDSMPKVKHFLLVDGKDHRREDIATMFSVHAALCNDGEYDEDDVEDDFEEDDVEDDFEADEVEDDIEEDDNGDGLTNELVDDRDIGTDSSIGYDGSGVLYTKRRCKAMHQGVVSALADLDRKDVLWFWDKLGHSMLRTVSCLFWCDELYRLSVYKYFSMTCWQQTPGEDDPIEHFLSHDKRSKRLKNRQDIESLRSIFEADDVICRMKEGTPSIHFAGPGRKVYQVTVRARHSLNISAMREMLLQGGYLNIENDVLVRNQQAPIEKLKFYWIVPQSRESTWKMDNPMLIGKTDPTEMKLLQECLDEHVTQFELALDPDLCDDEEEGRLHSP